MVWFNNIKISRLIIPLFIACFVSTNMAGYAKPRIIVLTDGTDVDQICMIRFLMYSTDYDIAGIIHVNSRFQPDGNRQVSVKDQTKWLDRLLETYGKLIPQLKKHNPNYPSVDAIKKVVKAGNENKEDLFVEPANMTTKDTEGEKLILETLLDNDQRPVHLACWGGANTAALALWKLKNSSSYSKDQSAKALAKVRIYSTWYKDGGGRWIEDNVKEATIFEAYGWARTWDAMSVDRYSGDDDDNKGTLISQSFNPGDVQKYMSIDWLRANINRHGDLIALNRQKNVTEDDTPTFLNLINNGLEAHTDYTMGGWGGRAVRDQPSVSPNHLTDDPGCSTPGCGPSNTSINDDANPKKMLWRWIPAAQNDYEARLDWCIMEFADANHPPVAKFNGTTINDDPVVRIDVAPNSEVVLDATGSTDPDKDSPVTKKEVTYNNGSLSYKWWIYKEAGTYSKTLSIKDSTSSKTSISIPSDASDKTIHVILEVKDNGLPNLTGYRRAIIKVGKASSMQESNRLQGSVEKAVIHARTINGLHTISLPDFVMDRSQIELYTLSGVSVPFSLIVSDKKYSISYQVNGVTLLKIITKKDTHIFKVTHP